MSKTLIIVPHPPNFMLGLDRRIHIKRTCQITDEVIEFSVSLADFSLWKNREQPIHKVFDYLTSGQREMMISGYTPKEWDHLFTETEEFDSK